MAKKLILGFVLILVICVGFSNKTHAKSNSFGVSPAAIRNELLLHGSHFEQEFILSRADPDEDAKAIIKIDDPLLSQWITFEPGMLVDMPKGEQRVFIKAIVDVPKNTELDIYTGVAQIVMQQLKSNGQVILLPAVSLPINLVVTDKSKSDLEILTISANDSYEGENVFFTIKSINKGNIDAKFKEMKIEFLTLSQESYSIHTISDFANIEPFSQKAEKILIPENTLKIGNYFANVSVYREGDTEPIYADMIAINILKAQNDDYTINSNLGYLLIFIGIILILGALVYIYKVKKYKLAL